MNPFERYRLFAADEEHLSNHAKRVEECSKNSFSFTDFFKKRQQTKIYEGGIGHIDVRGALGADLAPIEKDMGVVDSLEILEEIDALENAGMERLFLEVNSPGGSVIGISEVANRIANLGIPVVAHTQTLMASAGYHIAAGATQIVASNSALVGSIGVFMAWLNQEKLLEEKGLAFEMIKNKEGTYKGMNPPLGITEEQRELLQEEVDEAFDAFRSFIRTYRAVPDEAMQGQTFNGKKALDNVLIDKIGTKNDALELLMSL